MDDKEDLPSKPKVSEIEVPPKKLKKIGCKRLCFELLTERDPDSVRNLILHGTAYGEVEDEPKLYSLLQHLQNEKIFGDSQPIY